MTKTTEAEKPIGVKLMMPPAAYETAKAEARRNNIACTGTQIRIDVVRYYEGVARRRAKKKSEKRVGVRGGAKNLKNGRSLVKNIMA